MKQQSNQIKINKKSVLASPEPFNENYGSSKIWRLTAPAPQRCHKWLRSLSMESLKLMQ